MQHEALKTQTFYDHYADQPVLASTPKLRITGFCRNKFYCPDSLLMATSKFNLGSI